MSLEGPNTPPNPTIEAIRSIKGFDGLPADTQHELSNPTDSIQEHWPKEILEDDDLSKRLVSFFIDLSARKPYYDLKKEGGFKVRNLEKNRKTRLPETHCNHFLYVSEIASQLHKNLTQNPKESAIIEAINKMDLPPEDIQVLIILGSYTHDYVEDRIKKGLCPKDVIDELNAMLEKHGFGKFRKFLKPLVRILTHQMGESSEDYIEQINEPGKEFFKHKDVQNNGNSEGIKALAKLIKTSDIIHNHLSPQSASSLMKDDVYWPAVHEWFPHLEKRLPARFWKKALKKAPHAKLWWEYLKQGKPAQATSTYELMVNHVETFENIEDLPESDRKILELCLSWNVEKVQKEVSRVIAKVDIPHTTRKGVFDAIKESSKSSYESPERREAIKNMDIDQVLSELDKRILAIDAYKRIIEENSYLA